MFEVVIRFQCIYLYIIIIYFCMLFSLHSLVSDSACNLIIYRSQFNQSIDKDPIFVYFCSRHWQRWDYWAWLKLYWWEKFIVNRCAIPSWIFFIELITIFEVIKRGDRFYFSSEIVLSPDAKKVTYIALDYAASVQFCWPRPQGRCREGHCYQKKYILFFWPGPRGWYHESRRYRHILIRCRIQSVLGSRPYIARRTETAGSTETTRRPEAAGRPEVARERRYRKKFPCDNLSSSTFI